MAWYSHLFQNFPEFVVIHRVKGFSAVNEAEVDVLEFFYFYYNPMDVVASLVAQMVKCLPAMWETLVRVLGQEDPLEKEMATHSSIVAWRTPWTEEPERATVHGVAKSWTRLSNFTSSEEPKIKEPTSTGF